MGYDKIHTGNISFGLYFFPTHHENGIKNKMQDSEWRLNTGIKMLLGTASAHLGVFAFKSWLLFPMPVLG